LGGGDGLVFLRPPAFLLEVELPGGKRVMVDIRVERAWVSFPSTQEVYAKRRIQAFLTDMLHERPRILAVELGESFKIHEALEHGHEDGLVSRIRMKDNLTDLLEVQISLGGLLSRVRLPVPYRR
jgi:hypothetical protein